MVVRGIAIVAIWMLTEALVNAQCGGAAVQRATPVRNLIAARPICSTLQKIRANRMARRASCSGVQAACSGTQAAPSCSGPQAVPVVEAPQPKMISIQVEPIQYEIFQPPVCSGESCEIVRANAPRRFHSGMTSAFQQALASAQYRAANRIKGHSYLDTHRTSGVGWSSHNPMPATCLGVGGDNYAVAKGLDGWYASKIAE